MVSAVVSGMAIGPPAGVVDQSTTPTRRYRMLTVSSKTRYAQTLRNESHEPVHSAYLRGQWAASVGAKRTSFGMRAGAPVRAHAQAADAAVVAGEDANLFARERVPDVCDPRERPGSGAGVTDGWGSWAGVLLGRTAIEVVVAREEEAAGQ